MHSVWYQETPPVAQAGFYRRGWVRGKVPAQITGLRDHARRQVVLRARAWAGTRTHALSPHRHGRLSADDYAA